MIVSGPLHGIRLIELDAIGPVPVCGMILSGLGAEVIRIARPGGHAAFDDLGEGVVLRGRRTIELNLKDEIDREALLKLVGHADALIEGMRPGVMERLGIGPDACLARNPRLVYARGTGWGQHGPRARRAGHDINYIAMTGVLHAIGDGGREPSVPLNIVGDYAGGTMFLALGVVSALHWARSTGEGQVVDAAITDGVVNLMALFHAYLHTGAWTDRPAANLLDGAAPFYRCYRCQDGGFVAVGAIEPQFFKLLVEGLAVDPQRFDQSDRSCWPEMRQTFAERFASAPRAHWEAMFAGKDACVAPVLSMTEAMHHPDNVARNMFTRHDGIVQPAPAPRFSRTGGSIQPDRSASAAELLAEWSGETAPASC